MRNMSGSFASGPFMLHTVSGLYKTKHGKYSDPKVEVRVSEPVIPGNISFQSDAEIHQLRGKCFMFYRSIKQA